MGATTDSLDEAGFAGLKDPWDGIIPTITGMSKIIMRITDTRRDPEKVVVRALEGFELMQLSGWDNSFYKKMDAPLDGALLTSFAGNAFSAHACMPVAIAALGAAGKPGKQRVAPDTVEVSETESRDCQSCDSHSDLADFGE